MSSRNYRYFRQDDFSGGICEKPELAKGNQVLDARNFWAPDGILKQRPGTVEKGQLVWSSGSASGGATTGYVSFNAVTIQDGASGTLTDSSNFAVGEYLYCGDDAAFDHFQFNANLGGVWTYSTTNARAKAEYWNGTAWTECEYIENSDGGKFLAQNLNDTAGNEGRIEFYLGDTTGWATTSVNSVTKYWVRLSIRNGVAANNGTIASGPGGALIGSVAKPSITLRGLVKQEFSNATNYLRINASTTTYYYDLLRALNSGAAINAITGPTTAYQAAEPPTVGVIPEFNTAYVGHNNTVFECIGNTSVAIAGVNTRDEIVGTIAGIKSPYHPDYVPQLMSFPAANYVTYFKGLLWFAGIADQPFTIRWSAPAIDGAYNVLPEDSFEILSEDDNSPITALASLNEHLVVFKRDSIWLMVYSGLNDLELPTFAATKVVSGVGCVAQSTVQQCRGQLIFAAEDGIYAFDGSPNIKKLSETIDLTAQRIKDGKVTRATSVHWQAQGAYILAAAVNSSDNDFVFVYDYEFGAWWFWDSWTPLNFLRVEGLGDRETIYFTRESGLLLQVARYLDDTSVPSCSVTLHRWGDSDYLTKTLREVRIKAGSKVNSFEVTPYLEDQEFDAKTISFTSDNEDKYGTGVYGTATYSCNSRRERKIGFRHTGQQFNLKLDTFASTRGAPIEIFSVAAGYIPEGRR